METIYTYWINKRGLCATDELYSSRDKQTKTQQFPLPTNGIKPTKICNCLYIKSWKGERVSRFYVKGWSRFCFMVQTVSCFFFLLSLSRWNFESKKEQSFAIRSEGGEEEKRSSNLPSGRGVTRTRTHPPAFATCHRVSMRENGSC